MYGYNYRDFYKLKIDDHFCKRTGKFSVTGNPGISIIWLKMARFDLAYEATEKSKLSSIAIMKTLLTTLLTLAVLPSVLLGQEKTADEIAKELANPNTPLATLNFKNQFRFFDGALPGAEDQSSYTLLAQPAFPFSRDDGSMIFFRPAIPVIINQPIYEGEGKWSSESGLGDIGFDLAYGKTMPSGVIWAVGSFFSLPTATSALLGTQRISAGPEFLIGKFAKNYVVGIYPNHLWDVGGWGDNKVNVTGGQAFATYLPGGGWNVGSAPLFSYDWETEQWTVPINLTIGKTVIFGKTPWKLSAEFNYYVERPDSIGPEWMVGINISPVIKNPFVK